MRYHPQLMDLPDRALFYSMKDLESLPLLTAEEKEMLFELHKKFNCLDLCDIPGLNIEECREFKRLRNLHDNGKPMTEEEDARFQYLKD